MKKWVGIGCLGLILLVAGWLRWRYAQTISLYVDEFTTLWAARRVQELGVPWMPSGVLYTRGLLSTYIEAAFLSLFGFSYFVGRLPSILFGLATIGVLWLMGRRLWQAPVGLLAAWGLALLPEAILWSGRARFYAQLQCFTLLVVWAAFAGLATTLTRRQLVRRQILFALCFILALFSHEEMVLIYPSLVLGMLWWRGWRFFLATPVWLSHLVCLAALGLRYAIEKLGQPGYFETIQEQRPYVGIVFDLAGAWQTYSPLFLAPERLIWTLGMVIALALALFALARQQWRPASLAREHQATLFLLLQLFFVLIVVFTLVGTSWREGRYLFFIQPLWLLTGAAGIGLLLARLTAYRWLHPIVLAMVLSVSGVMLWPHAQAVLGQQVEGYDRALGWLAEVRQADEIVLSPQPPACALVLGPCDYYAVQRGYEEFVIQRDGVRIDRWSGATLLNSAEQLQRVLETAPRTWFVTDSFRLATRYEADFVRMVIEQFDLAYAVQGVMVLRAESWREPAAAPQTLFTPPHRLGPLALVGYAWPQPTLNSPLPVTLLWQGVEPIHEQINTSLRLVDSNGQLISRADGPPARGLIPTNLFFDMPLPDSKMLTVPAELADGLYRLETLAYRAATVEPLTDVAPVAWWQKGTPPPPDQPVDVTWQDGIRLAGMDTISTTLAAGATLPVRLIWSANAQPKQDYTLFVHLVDETGVPLAQNDRPPLNNFYPTSAWTPATSLAETYTLQLPEALAPGTYRLITGLYDPVTNARLLRTDGTDAYELATVTVTE